MFRLSLKKKGIRIIRLNESLEGKGFKESRIQGVK